MASVLHSSQADLSEEIETLIVIQYLPYQKLLHKGGIKQVILVRHPRNKKLGKTP
jgi:hypothetical protein